MDSEYLQSSVVPVSIIVLNSQPAASISYVMLPNTDSKTSHKATFQAQAIAYWRKQLMQTWSIFKGFLATKMCCNLPKCLMHLIALVLYKSLNHHCSEITGNISGGITMKAVESLAEVTSWQSDESEVTTMAASTDNHVACAHNNLVQIWNASEQQ